jgi:hypothetical protein
MPGAKRSPSFRIRRWSISCSTQSPAGSKIGLGDILELVASADEATETTSGKDKKAKKKSGKTARKAGAPRRRNAKEASA